MKNLMKNTVRLLFIAAAITGCSDFNEAKTSSEIKNTCTISGTFSAGSALPSEIAEALSGTESTARSATSSFNTDSNFIVSAYHMVRATSEADGETWQIEDTSKYLNGSVNKETMTWSVEINQSGMWEIDISLWKRSDNNQTSTFNVLSGEKRISIDSNKFFNQVIESEPIVLDPKARDSVSGAVSLEIQTDAELSGINYTFTSPASDEKPAQGTANFSTEGGAKVAAIEETGLPAGTYSLELVFKSADGKPVYTCTETVTVFSGFTTDTWYGTAPYLLGREGSDGRMAYTFMLSKDYLESLKSSQVTHVDEPIVIYDLDRLKKGKEFADPKPGFNVFDSITGGESIGDGLALAEGRPVSDFTIDPVTQAIYTIEKNASMSSNVIVKYPSYAGYAKGKVIAQVPDASSFCVYDGKIYLYDEEQIFRPFNGDTVFFNLTDENDERLSLNGINNTKIAVHKNTLYAAYTYYDGSTNYIGIKKFTISCDTSTDTYTLKQTADLKKTTDELASQSYVNLSVSDIQVKDNGSEVYILVYNHEQGKSRGGIIRIHNTDDSFSFHDFKTPDETENKWIYGWTRANRPSTDASNECFYGGTKFIARKEDELVIADEGGYNEDNKQIHKNRVVKVNLETFAMNAVDVNVGFDSYLANCGFDSYTGASYYN